MPTNPQLAPASRPAALITGASSGFGIEFAKLFAADGHNLLLTSLPNEDLAKTAKSIQETYNVQVWTMECDLARPKAAQAIYDWSHRLKVDVDTLVNNAGIGIYGSFTDHDLAKEQELVQLNVNALTELCHLYLPDFISRGGGKILNVASIAGLQAGPLYATYFASKGYVLLFSEALHEEYAPHNITVTALCPGVARTGFFERAGMREDSLLLRTYLMNPEQVTKAGYSALLAGRSMCVPGIRNKVVAFGYRILPRRVITKIALSAVRSAAGK